MLKHVAVALEGYRMDTGYVISMDGLVATTSLVPDTGDEPMEIGSIQKITCYNCGREGHVSKGVLGDLALPVGEKDMGQLNVLGSIGLNLAQKGGTLAITTKILIQDREPPLQRAGLLQSK